MSHYVWHKVNTLYSNNIMVVCECLVDLGSRHVIIIEETLNSSLRHHFFFFRGACLMKTAFTLKTDSLTISACLVPKSFIQLHKLHISLSN